MLLLVLPWSVNAQPWKSKPFSVSIINNATILPPASILAPFNQPLHPGVALGYEFGWRETIKNPKYQEINTTSLGGNKVYTGKWFQDVKLSYFYHEYFNHAFILSTQAGYRKYIKKFSAEGSLHLGYMHAFLVTEQFERQADGSWQKNNLPNRGYGVAGAGIGVGYDAGYNYNIRRFFVNYDFRLQMPFIKSYVPLLPNGILSVGLQFTLFNNYDGDAAYLKRQLECPSM